MCVFVCVCVCVCVCVSDDPPHTVFSLGRLGSPSNVVSPQFTIERRAKEENLSVSPSILGHGTPSTVTSTSYTNYTTHNQPINTHQ